MILVYILLRMSGLGYVIIYVESEEIWLTMTVTFDQRELTTRNISSCCCSAVVS